MDLYALVNTKTGKVAASGDGLPYVFKGKKHAKELLEYGETVVKVNLVFVETGEVLKVAK